ncbi:MAG: hypothetical protein RDV00_00970 [Clostridia bacterium]|nr:hypothetical protein [Clostridia bacterium]
MLFIVAPLVTFVLPASREFVLYWVPTFWTFAGFRAILVEGATWAEVWRLAGWNLALRALSSSGLPSAQEALAALYARPFYILQIVYNTGRELGLV